MAAIVLLAAGAVLMIGGATVIYWPAGVIVAGLCVALVGLDLIRPTPTTPAPPSGPSA